MTYQLLTCLNIKTQVLYKKLKLKITIPINYWLKIIYISFVILLIPFKVLAENYEYDDLNKFCYQHTYEFVIINGLWQGPQNCTYASMGLIVPFYTDISKVRGFGISDDEELCVFEGPYNNICYISPSSLR